MGIDVGGTFTDLVLYDDINGTTDALMVETTYPDHSQGVINVITQAAEGRGLDLRHFLREVRSIVHGSTFTTNAALNRDWVKTGLITTRGFRDILELRRGIKKEQFDMREVFPPPIVPRHLSVGIRERIAYDGQVIVPMQTAALKQASEIFKRENVRSLAVCFLHSWINGEHEKKARAVLAKLLPGTCIVSSSEILPEIGEYERISTTVLSASLQPIFEDYLNRIASFLKENGYNGELFVMQSNGGVKTWRQACKFTVCSLLSGPSAGPVAAKFVAKGSQVENFVYAEMGGTSFEACICPSGLPLVTTENEFAGYRIAIPMVDMHIIGAGGGSIAWIDKMGALKVGPKSSGADPGPACYNKGGSQPTVTDADLILGYLNPNFFLGGQMKLDQNIAQMVTRKKIGDVLHMDVTESAEAIFQIANSNMAGSLNMVSVRRGYDLRDFALVVGGGAAPIHIASLAEEVGGSTVIIPHRSAVFCAMGMLFSDIKHDFVRSYYCLVSENRLSELNKLLVGMEKQSVLALESEGFKASEVTLQRSCDMRYQGQFHEVNVLFSSGPINKEVLQATLAQFHQRHETLFGYSELNDPCEFLNLRITAVGETQKPLMPSKNLSDADPSQAFKTS